MSHLVSAVGIKICAERYGYKTVSVETHIDVIITQGPSPILGSQQYKKISEISLEMVGFSDYSMWHGTHGDEFWGIKGAVFRHV